MIIRTCFIWLLLLTGACGTASALVNSWTNPASAHWEDAFWSLGVGPGNNQSVTITNDGYKAVGIFPSTAGKFPGSMTVSNLNISAPSNGLSTLLLNYSGTAVPLRVLNGCTIGTNGLLEILYSGFQVDSGQFNLNSGQLIQEGGTTVATNVVTSVVGGSVNLTNATMNLGTLVLDGYDYSSFGTVTQAGGVTTCDLSIRAGNYNLVAGSLSGTCSVSGPLTGRLTQYGGTNYGTISLGHSAYFSGGAYGIYTLYDGAVVSSALSIGPVLYSGGEFDQAAGYVSVGLLSLGSYSFRSFPGQGTYSLTNGTLLSGSVNMINGDIRQAGGQHTMSNGLSLYGNLDERGSDNRSVYYSLWGGNLSCPSTDMGLYGYFSQSGGTNTVAGNLAFVNTSYTLSGGVLLASNTVVSQGYFSTSDGTHFHSQFLQSGGQHRVSNTLSNLDQYVLSGGSLFAGRIVLRGTMIVSNAAVISNPGLFDFGGIFRLYGGSPENLGQMLLSANSLIDLPPGTHTLAFSNSNPIAWSNGSTLTVTNWNGSINGGGSDRLLFGNSDTGLTQAQLSHIQFVNPAGFRAGFYPARILGTGEVVPAPRPVLLSSRTGNNLIVAWAGAFVLQSSTNVQGPFVDVPGAASPYTNLTTQFPSQFFRLRQ